MKTSLLFTAVGLALLATPAVAEVKLSGFATVTAPMSVHLIFAPSILSNKLSKY